MYCASILISASCTSSLCGRRSSRTMLVGGGDLSWEVYDDGDYSANFGFEGIALELRGRLRVKTVELVGIVLPLAVVTSREDLGE
jgi:hypothetical protein